MPGPLPEEQAARRNAPTIPTMKIPAGGRRGAVPKPPAWITLGDAGTAWWRWAWKTPQACAWDDGQLVKVAHRAMLEDDLAMAGEVEAVDLVAILHAEIDREVRMIISRLAGLVTGRLQILARIGDLDDKLGLSPKGRDQLRLKIVADTDYYPAVPKKATKAAAKKVTNLQDRRNRIADDAT